MNIVVLCGGASREREVSLRTGAAVTKALRSKNHVVKVIDPKDGLDSIGEPDVVFPALHGVGGEDGSIQAELEKRGIPYVGADSTASALCLDKWAYRTKLQEAGLPVAKGAIVDANTIWQSPLASQPYVIKPVDGGSTIDTFIVRDPNTANKPSIEKALRHYRQMLIEELIEGTELTVGILGNEALPPIEIIPPEGGEFDYENKYNGKTRELCPAVSVSDELQEQAKALALKAHKVTGCKDISRTDIFVRPDDSLVILETNTIPGMTDQSLYPKAAKTIGIDFPELVDRLVKMAKV